MARPLTQIIEQRNNSIPPHRPFHGMWGGRMTSCVGQCHKKSRGQTFHLCNFCFCDYCLIFLCAGGGRWRNYSLETHGALANLLVIAKRCKINERYWSTEQVQVKCLHTFCFDCALEVEANWSAWSPSTPTIRARIPLKTTFFLLNLCLKERK